MVEAQGVEALFTCSSCGSEVWCHYVQYCMGREIGWEREFSCRACNCSQAFYDLGPPPRAIRDLILERHGTWVVWIESRAQMTVVLKVLKQELRFSNDELKMVMRMIPGVILKGTKVEMEWSAHLLRQSNIQCSVVDDRNSVAMHALPTASSLREIWSLAFHGKNGNDDPLR